MNKADLIAKVATAAEVSKVQAQRMVDAFIDAVAEALAEGDHVTLTGFGRFAVASRAARQGRHPRTGEAILIPARKVPTFVAGRDLQETVEPRGRRHAQAARPDRPPQ